MRWGWVSLDIGDPLWVPFSPPVCQPCHLFGLTSQQVRYHDDEERDYCAEGQSISEVEADVWRTWENPALAEANRILCNSTENTAATSMDGWGAPRITGWSALASDDWRFLQWLRMFGHNPERVDL